MAPLAPSKLKLASKSQKSGAKTKSTASGSAKSLSKFPSVSSASKQKVTTVAPPAPVPENDEATGDEDEDSEGQDRDGAHLRGFSTDEDSSDDDADEAPEIPGVDISRLPTIARDDTAVKKKLEQAKKQASQDRGVLYISRIPHGFYEDEMKAYFSQFGNVTRLRLSRNKKTGKSKHYGFLEFDSASVAQIVSETMDNYLLMGHILQCKVVPKDEVHPELWVGANRKWRAIPRDRIHRVSHNKSRTETQQKRVERKLLKKQADRQAKIRAAGIDYDIGAGGYRLITLAK